MSNDTTTIQLLGISGSLRSESFNTQLLQAASQMLPDHIDFSILEYADVPLYNADIDTDILPPAVARTRQQAHEADAFLVATPEYNHMIPGTIKNLFDWLSRPAVSIPKPFPGKPIAIMGATPGIGATRLAQNSWLTLIHALSMQLFSGNKLMIPRVKSAFTDDGHLVSYQAERLQQFLDAYITMLQSAVSTQ